MGAPHVLHVFTRPRGRGAFFTFYFPVTPVWLTVTVVPLMLTVPVRVLPVLVETEKVTVPLPFPVAPETKEIHETLVDALHAQVPEACTGIVSCLVAYPTLKPEVVR